MIWAGYIAIGFLIASALVKFCDVFEPGDEDMMRVVIFTALLIFWPAVALYWGLRLPYVLLTKYISYLSDR